MKFFLLVVITSMSVFHSMAQRSPVYVSAKNIAVNGYDVVSYFTESKAVKGNSNNTFEWNNAIWYFSTPQNLESFKAAPDQYAPQFGGYCAYGTSEGHKAPTEPDAWTIANGKLYFNYNKDVRELWLKDKEALIEKANNIWITIKDAE